MRLPQDSRGIAARAKGFGYVEFEDRNSLIEALSLPDTVSNYFKQNLFYILLLTQSDFYDQDPKSS